MSGFRSRLLFIITASIVLIVLGLAGIQQSVQADPYDFYYTPGGNYTIVPGQNVTFTTCNFHYKPPHVDFDKGTKWNLEVEGNTLSVFINATRGYGKSMWSGLGVHFIIDWNDFEHERNMPVVVTFTFSGYVDAYWPNKKNGSANAKITILNFNPTRNWNPKQNIRPEPNSIAFVGTNNSPYLSSHSRTNTRSGDYWIETFTTKGEGAPLTLENLPPWLVVDVFCNAYNKGNFGELYSSSAGISLKSIKVEFLKAPAQSATTMPVASFTCYPDPQFVGKDVIVDTTYSVDGKYPIERSIIEFGDQYAPEKSDARRPQVANHRYSVPGCYTVTLTVIDSQGTQDTTSRTITILPRDGIEFRDESPLELPDYPQPEDPDELRERAEWILARSLRPEVLIIPAPGKITPISDGFMSGTILPSQRIKNEFQIPSVQPNMIMFLQYPGSELDLILYAPDGMRIGPEEQGKNGTYYYKNLTTPCSYYYLEHPAPGKWTAEVVAIDVNPEGEPYALSVYNYTNKSAVTGIPSRTEAGHDGSPRPLPTPAAEPLLSIAIMALVARAWGRKDR